MADKQFGKKGWTSERLGSLEGKTYLITGANSGTGFEASKILLTKGAKVVILNRNPRKSEDAIAALKASSVRTTLGTSFCRPAFSAD